jgi:hypothetical protein
MDRMQKAVVTSLILTSALAWIASIDQLDMMIAMNDDFHDYLQLIANFTFYW